MQARRINDEVYVADQRVVQVAAADIAELKALAGATPRRRARLCAHRGTDDTLHEMMIVLDRATYVRPHRHRDKSESFHVVEGLLSVVLFEEDGRVLDVIRMGDYASGRQFYYRLAEPLYHTVLVESDLAVIHETTNGPFIPTQTEFAPWAPAEEERGTAERYTRQLKRAIHCPSEPGA